VGGISPFAGEPHRLNEPVFQRRVKERAIAKKKGTWPAEDPHDKVDMKCFGYALDKALDKWDSNDGSPVTVVFSAEVTPNPGGIKTYVAEISG